MYPCFYESCLVMSNSLLPQELYSPWNSPGQNTGVGSHFLLQGVFPTQGSNQGLPHSKRILHRLSHQGSPVSIDKVFAKVSQTVSQRWSTGFCPGNPLSQLRVQTTPQLPLSPFSHQTLGWVLEQTGKYQPLASRDLPSRRRGISPVKETTTQLAEE